MDISDNSNSPVNQHSLQHSDTKIEGGKEEYVKGGQRCEH